MLSRLPVHRQAGWRELRIPRSPRRSGHRRCRVGFRPGTVRGPTLGPPASERTQCQPRSGQGPRDPAVAAGSAVALFRPDEECSRMCSYLPEVILPFEPTKGFYFSTTPRNPIHPLALAVATEEG